MLCDCRPIRQMRTSPSMPPDMIFPQSVVPAIEVTPCTWASLMMYMGLPDCG